MFERFTDRARRVVVLAQDEARGLQHNYIGTEHILLGLIGASEGIAARVLERFEMPIEAVREEVRVRVGPGSGPPPRRIPFTPRGKKVLELSLREALALQHNYIGTEHILLGLIREGDGVGAEIIKAHAGDLLKVRMAVLDLVPPGRPVRGQRRRRRRLGLLPGAEAGVPDQPAEMEPSDLLPDETGEARTTPAAESSLGEALRLAAGESVGSHHLLLAALTDPDTVAARTLAGLGVDLEQAREALRHADVTGTSDEQPEDAGRRQMRIQVTGDHVTVETSDQAVVGLGRAAVEALGGQAGEPGVITGDQPASASLSDLWLALRDSLEDVRRRAVALADTGAEPVDAGAEPRGGDQPAAPETGTGSA